MEDNKRRDLANKSFGNIISDGFNLFKKCYWKLLLPMASFYIIYLIIKVFLLADLYFLSYRLEIEYIQIDPENVSEADYDRILLIAFIELLIYFLDFLIRAIFTVIAMCSVSLFVYKKYMNEEVNFLNQFKKAFNPKMLLVIILIGICIPLSIWILMIPGLIIFGRYIFTVYTYNMENTEEGTEVIQKKNLISKAQLISKGSFLKIFAIFLITILITFIIQLGYSIFLLFIWNVDNATLLSWYDPNNRNYGMIILYELIYVNLVNIIFIPLFICLITPLFASCKARYELGELYYPPKRQPDYKPYPAQEPYPAQQSYPAQMNTWQSRIQEGPGIYCPYCGHKIDNPIKFCPSCGESIEFK